MTLARPDARVTLEGLTLNASEAGVASLRMDLGFNSHDRLRLTLWRDSKFASAAPGQALSVLLTTGQDGGGPLPVAGGLPDGLPGGGEDVTWTGTVESVSTSAGSLQIDGLASTSVLSQTRRSTTWTDQSVADVVADLAGELDNEIDADLQLSNFSIDNRRTVWAHLRELARLSGAELSCAPGGGVRFILATQETAATELRYGAELIFWQLTRRAASTAVGAAEHGAGSSAGGDKWHWLAHDPVGTGDAVLATPAAFHTRDAARQYTAATQARATRAAVRGNVWLGGRPELRPGMLVTLTGIPEGDTEPLRISAVTHALDGASGCITALAVEGSGGGGSLLPGGIL
jgi:phage protein D